MHASTVVKCSQDEQEDQDEELDHDDDPQVAVVRRSQQVLHLVVSVDHVFLGMIDVLTEFLYASILALDLGVEILGLVLRGLDDTDDFIELVVLVANHLLLVLQDLPVVEIPRLIELAVFAALVPSLLLLGGQRGLVALD